MIILSSPKERTKRPWSKKFLRKKFQNISFPPLENQDQTRSMVQIVFTTQKNFEELIKENSFLEH